MGHSLPLVVRWWAAEPRSPEIGQPRWKPGGRSRCL